MILLMAAFFPPAASFASRLPHMPTSFAPTSSPTQCPSPGTLRQSFRTCVMSNACAKDYLEPPTCL